MIKKCVEVNVLLILFLIWTGPVNANWSHNPTENDPVSVKFSSQYDTQILSDGSGGAFVTWRDYQDGTYDIYLQRLDDTGDPMWTEGGVAVCTAAYMQYDPELVSDGNGGVLVIWEDSRPYPAGSDIYAQRVNSGGLALWATDGVPICTATGHQYEPIPVSDGDGGAIIVWKDYRNGLDYDLYAQRFDGTGAVLWATDGVIVSTATDFQTDPQLVEDGAGGVVICWADARSGIHDIYAQRLDDQGTPQWAAGGVPVCAATGDQEQPQITGGGSGGAVICWRDNRSGAGYDIYAQEIDGTGTAQWTANGVAVCTAADSQENPQIASNGSGGVTICWDDYRSAGDTDIYAQWLDNTGTPLWDADGVVVCAAVDHQEEPQLLRSGTDSAIIVWQDEREGTGYQDLYAQRLNSSGEALWTADGIPLSTAPDSQRGARLASDGDDGVIVAWNDLRNGDNDIYAQKIDWYGRLGGPAWTHSSFENVPIVTEEEEQWSPQPVSDGEGGVIIVWQDSRNGDPDIYAQRQSASGHTLWPAGGVVVCDATDFQSSPSVISDGAGGAIIAWYDDRSGTGYYNIYVQRIDSSGNSLWLSNGKSICSAQFAQSSPKLVSDGAGGAIVVWKDYRSGIDYDIYAQRISPNGNEWWNDDGGEPICTAVDDQMQPDLVSDGMGGAIIAWHDNRNDVISGFDIYAQRVDQDGDVQWTTNGVEVVSTQIFDQLYPHLASDGMGGAIIAWEDDRNGYANIYAQRLSDTGSRLWSAGGVRLSAQSDEQIQHRLVSDGLGGAIVVWEVTSGYRDIYAQRVESSGATLWTADGAAVCTAVDDQLSPELVSDGENGAVVVWSDERFGLDDVYAQRLDVWGNGLWQENGVAVSTAANHQYAPALVNDDDGGVLISWIDMRSELTLQDIYAERLDRHGYLGRPEPLICEVADHPLDQGGVAVLSWKACGLDQFPHQEVTHYSVWMHQPDRTAESPETKQRFKSLDALERAGWVEVGDVTATYQTEYGYHAPTYGDYTGSGEYPWTEYLVMAHTSDSFVFWESNIGQGYSVDNLSPGAPLSLNSEPTGPDAVLNWTASGQHDEDLAFYRVHRSASSGFTPEESTRVGVAEDLSFIDANPGGGTWYYRVTAEDVHGNEGQPSNEASAAFTVSTVSTSLTCIPASGTLPFATQMRVIIYNDYSGQFRRMSGRINARLAGGAWFPGWRAGFTNIGPSNRYQSIFGVNFPALGSLVGVNTFTLTAADVTPAPYNQPPYPAAGDTDSDGCTVTGVAP